MLGKIVTVFGASGFIGSYIVHELLQNGFVVNVFTRQADNVKHLKPLASLGYLNVIVGDIFNNNDLSNAIKDVNVIINCVGAISGKKRGIFSLNYEFPKLLSDLLNEVKNDVEQIIHFSAILNENSVDHYTKSKISGRDVLLSSKCKVAILNPSVVFGEEDNFFNFFAKLAKYSFVLPLINDGQALIQPIYVVDVAKFVIKVIQNKSFGNFYLVGSEKYSLKNILQFICSSINKKRFFINIPNKLIKLIAYLCEIPIFSIVSKIVIGKFQPFITQTQVSLLSFDNVSQTNSLLDFDIVPKLIKDVVPKYLERYK